MLGDKPATATIAVKDLALAQKFYTETLGLEPGKLEEGGGGQLFTAGNSKIFVYKSGTAGTNQATACSWGVGDDLEKVIADLKGKGVKFEQYDGIPNVTREGDIHITGELQA